MAPAVSRPSQDPSDAESTTDKPKRLRWIVLAGLWLIYSAFGMIATSLAPLVPEIMRDLDIGHTMMGAIFGAWQLVFIFAAIPCGALLDRIGVERGLLLGALVIAVSAMLRGLATNELIMILAMAVFGAGGPIVSTGAPKVVAQWFKGKERGLAMGIYITGPAIGSITALSLTNSVLMPLVGNDWRTVQWIWTAYALAAGVVWLMLTTRLAIGNGAAGSRAGEPQGYWSVVRDLLGIRTVRLIMIMSVGIFVINHGLNNWLPEILRAKNMSAAQAGYWAALPTIVGLAGSLLIPRLATPQRRGFILMGLCVAALVATLLLQADPGGLLIGGLILQGIARSSLTTVAILTLVETPQIGETRAATASGMFFSAAEVGGASGPLMVGVMHATTGSFLPALGFLTGVAGLLLIGAYQLHAARRTPANV